MKVHSSSSDCASLFAEPAGNSARNAPLDRLEGSTDNDTDNDTDNELLSNAGLRLRNLMPQPLVKARYIWPWAVVCMSVVDSGCAVMNSFQTPDILEPGDVTMSPGVVVFAEGPTEDRSLPRGRLIPLGRGLQMNARIGVLSHLDLGLHVTGVHAAGADVKTGFDYGRFRLAANAGFGYSKKKRDPVLFGLENWYTQTRFAGIFVGYRGAYVGLKATDYRHRRQAFESSEYGVQRYNRIIPGLTIGILGQPVRNAKPILEMNLYSFPDEVVFTLGMGVQINLNGTDPE